MQNIPLLILSEWNTPLPQHWCSAGSHSTHFSLLLFSIQFICKAYWLYMQHNLWIHILLFLNIITIISFLDLKCFYFPFIQTYFLSLPFLLCIFPLWSDKCFFAKELREKKNLYVLFFLGEFSHSKNHCWGYVSLLTLWVFFMWVIGCTDPSRVL